MSVKSHHSSDRKGSIFSMDLADEIRPTLAGQFQMYDLLNECQRFADLYNCSTERTEVIEAETDRSL